jgi:putative membrane protein
MSDKAVFRLVAAISIFVLGVVVILNRKILPAPAVMPDFVSLLPMLNAILNGSCAFLLICSLWAIRKKNIQLHKKINITAFIFSSVFLISYILAHYFMPDVRFGDINHDGVLDDGEKAEVSGVRGTYLLILTSHIILAAAVLPVILLSFYYGLKNEVIKHKKIVRFTYPIWLYVTITGVVVYMMVKPYYPF